MRLVRGTDRSSSGNWFAGVGNYARRTGRNTRRAGCDLGESPRCGMKFGLWFAPQIVDESWSQRHPAGVRGQEQRQGRAALHLGHTHRADLHGNPGVSST